MGHVHFESRFVRSSGQIFTVAILWLSCLILFPSRSVAQGAQAAIVLSPHEAYRAAASVVEQTLTAKGHKVIIFELPKNAQLPPASQPVATTTAPADSESDAVFKRLAEAKPAVVVTVGETAALLVVDRVQRTPVIYSMITNAPDFLLTDKNDPRRSRVAGVTTDAPPKQQIEWILRVRPKAANIGILCSFRSKKTAEAVREAGQARNLTFTIIETTKDEFIKAAEELDARRCDGVLIIPDAQIYSATSVRHLLLWGIRSKKSVWAFSEPAVKAGALAALYTDSAAVARQTAEVVLKVLSGTSVSSIGLQYPSELRRAVNERTAEMIGLPLSQEVLDAATARFGKE